MKIVISEFMDEAALAGFDASDRVIYSPDLVDDRIALLKEVTDADALIVRNRTKVDQELLASANQLVVVGRLGVGLDNIDMDACAGRGIKVHPATGANTLSVAEYVITAALVLFRGSYFSQQDMVSGTWPRQRLVGGEVSGRTMGLIGYGEIARAVASRAKALGMSIAAYDPFLPADNAAWTDVTRAETVEKLLASSDVVSLHVPLTQETRNLIDADAITKMRRASVLINTARGGIVDDEAVVAALKAGHLRGAALDVFENEPLTGASAQIFEGVQNIILTPHIAGVTDEGNVRVSKVTVENVMKELANVR